MRILIIFARVLNPYGFIVLLWTISCVLDLISSDLSLLIHKRETGLWRGVMRFVYLFFCKLLSLKSIYFVFWNT